VTDPLDAPEQAAVAAVLASAWGAPVALASVSGLASRDHVARVATAGGRSAVVKRLRRPGDSPWPIDPEGLRLERATLDHLAAAAPGVAPRLLGGDDALGVVVMEEVPVRRTLADSLLGPDAGAACEDVLAWARTMAAMHAGTLGTADGFDAARRRRGLPVDRVPWWLARLEVAAGAFATLAPASRVTADIARIRAVLTGVHVGLVHGDPCPDNVLISEAGCHLIDFEQASMASVALDFAYLLAPFPSCWCFGRLPRDLVVEAVAGYEGALADAGVTLGDEWTEAVAAALAAFAVVRVGNEAASPDDGTTWGTTTMRPRLAAWTGSLLAAPGNDAFPHVTAAVAAWREDQGLDGPDVDPVPDYRAFG
jgi:Ser/Thr protein kinase RdoA (MazF antagonist)